jgi:hypothetical protein
MLLMLKVATFSGSLSVVQRYRQGRRGGWIFAQTTGRTLEPVLPAASYPPFHKTQGRGTHYKRAPLSSRLRLFCEKQATGAQKRNTLMNSVRYVGMDVHRETISAAVLDESGLVRLLRDNPGVPR